MKRQIIKTRPQTPYIIARVIIVIVAVALVLAAAYEIASRAGLRFH